MKLGFVQALYALGTSVLMGSAVCADNLVENSSIIVEKRSFFDRLTDVSTLSYYGVYRGAPLSNLKAPSQPSVSGNPAGPQSLESTVTAGYKLSPSWMVGVVGHSLYYPIGNPTGTGHDMALLDPWLIATKTNAIDRAGYKLSLRFTVELPLVKIDLLQSNQLSTAMTSAFINNYLIPHTQITLGVFAYLRGYIPRGDALSQVITYRVYVAPNLNWQLSSRVAATLWVDYIQANRNKGTGFLAGLTNDVIDIEPGINIDITKSISFNPILNIYPSHPTLASSSLQAFITAKAF